MSTIDLLFEADIIRWVYITLIVMSGVTAICVIISKFCDLIGKPIKWFHRNNTDHELLLQTAQCLSTLQEKQKEDVEQSIKHDREIKNDLEKLTKMFIDKQIDDMRWELLDFSSALTSGRKYNREVFDHIFKTYRTYEKILEENNMENGLVTESMKVCEEIYHERLKAGEIK